MMIGVGKSTFECFDGFHPQNICQLPQWQIRDGDSHKVQKVLICFMRSLEYVAYFAHCPWVRLYPDVGGSTGEARICVSNFLDFLGPENRPF